MTSLVRISFFRLFSFVVRLYCSVLFPPVLLFYISKPEDVDRQSHRQQSHRTTPRFSQCCTHISIVLERTRLVLRSMSHL